MAQLASASGLGPEGPVFESQYPDKKRDVVQRLFFCRGTGGAEHPILLCLGALPLLYPAAPPSVFAFCKYTAPAVALEREYVVGFLVVMVWGFFFLRDDGLRCGDNFVFGYILLEDLTGKSSSIGVSRYFYLCLRALPLLYLNGRL